MATKFNQRLNDSIYRHMSNLGDTWLFASNGHDLRVVSYLSKIHPENFHVKVRCKNCSLDISLYNNSILQENEVTIENVISIMIHEVNIATPCDQMSVFDILDQ